MGARIEPRPDGKVEPINLLPLITRSDRSAIIAERARAGQRLGFAPPSNSRGSMASVVRGGAAWSALVGEHGLTPEPLVDPAFALQTHRQGFEPLVVHGDRDAKHLPGPDGFLLQGLEDRSLVKGRPASD